VKIGSGGFVEVRRKRTREIRKLMKREQISREEAIRQLIKKREGMGEIMTDWETFRTIVYPKTFREED